MNSGFSGADVAQLRVLSSRLKAESGKLHEIIVSSSVALLAAEWTGNEIDAIRANWKQRSVPRLTGLADALQQMGAELDKQALQQEQASGASAGSAIPFGDQFDAWLFGIIGGIIGVAAPKAPAKPVPHEATPKAVPAPQPAPAPAPAPIPTPNPNGPLQPPPSQSDFDSRGSKYGDLGDLGPGQGNGGQCTAWVLFRRKQLGLDCPAANLGLDGGLWAGHMGQHLSEPQAGAVGSFGNHTFIVESVNPGPPKTMNISEMNFGNQVGPKRWNTEGEFKVTANTFEWNEATGLWKSKKLISPQEITFGT